MSDSSSKLILIAVAGAVGTLARYWLGSFVQRSAGMSFPWGTFTVNMAGSFLFGAVWALAEARFSHASLLRTVLLTGFMGAFTTFSTFMFETSELLRASRYFLAFGNVALHNLCGIAFLFLGFSTARLL